MARESELPALILGPLCILGGTMGYARTGSVPSAAAGIIVGGLYTAGGLRIRNRQRYGIEFSLIASALLAASSVPRALRTSRPLPTGMSILAVYALLYYMMRYKKTRKYL